MAAEEDVKALQKALGAAGTKISNLKKAKAPEAEIAAAVAEQAAIRERLGAAQGRNKVSQEAEALADVHRCNDCALCKKHKPAAPAGEASAAAGAEEQVVNPWEIKGGEKGIDYDKLIRDFGSLPIDATLLEKIAQVSKKPVHHWLRRGLFFSHRDLAETLESYEKGNPFYLYTGRGPSSESMHMGHLIPFIFTKYLQEAFDVPLVIQMTDDEKYLWKDLTLAQVRQFMRENVKDIIAVGFDPRKTFIFSDLDYMGGLYETVVQIQRCITTSASKATFGFNESNNVGQLNFVSIQAAPSFPSAFKHIFGERRDIRCLIPCAIDQDPYFRVTRDVAPRLGFHKPALIHSKFFPSLNGPKTKMSSSDTSSAIYLTDTPEMIREKVGRSVSGGGVTREIHERDGGNTDVDVPYQYLSVFLEDDAKLEQIRVAYSTGKMSTQEIKQELVDCVVPLVQAHQARRALITEAEVDEFLRARPLAFDYSAAPRASA